MPVHSRPPWATPSPLCASAGLVLGFETLRSQSHRKVEGVLPLRMFRRHRLDLIESKGKVKVDRLFRPERAVIVEGGDPLGQRHEIRTALRRHPRDEVGNRLLLPRRRSTTAEHVCASDATCTTKQKIAKRTTAIGFLTASPDAVRDAVAVAGVPYLLYFVPFCSIDSSAHRPFDQY